MDTFNKILISYMILNDATMRHDSVYIYLSTFIWWSIYEGFTMILRVFTRDLTVMITYLWGPYGRTYGEAAYGLDWYYDVLPLWVVWLAFQPRWIWGVVGMPRYCRVTYPGQHQWSGLVCYIWWFHYTKFINICFTCICIMI